jgi:tripartite-type tricarboxylate transporter receptor subunit TctC
MGSPGQRYRAVAAAVVVVLFGLISSSDADAFPNRPITIVVAFAPGGVADTTARLLANGMQSTLGQTVVVENRPGAGGDIAAGVVARSAPDGYTLLLTTTAFAINMTLNKSKQFSADSFVAIALPASSPEVLAVNKDNPADSLRDILKSAKGKPLNFGTAGVGSASHIMADYFFKKVANVAAVHIPFQGGAPAINALLGNQIDVMAAILGGGVAGQIKSGQLRGVAVASAERARVVPEVPTFAEAGYTGMNFADWVGLFAPRGTSPSIIKLLNSQVENVLKEPEMLAKLDALGFEPMFGNSADSQRDFDADVAKWARLVDSIGLTLN